MSWNLLIVNIILIGLIILIFYLSYKNFVDNNVPKIIPEIISEYVIVDPKKPLVFEYTSTSLLYTQIVNNGAKTMDSPTINNNGIVTVPPNTNSGLSPAGTNVVSDISLEKPLSSSITLQTGIACYLSTSGIAGGSITTSSLKSGRKTVTSQPQPATIASSCTVGESLGTKNFIPSKNIVKGLPLDFNYISKINLSNALVLENLEIVDGGLSEVIFEKAPKLKNIDFTSNSVETIDLSNVPALEIFVAPYNNFKSIDFSKNTNLTEISLSYNPDLESINTTNLTQLKKITLENVNTNNTGKVYIEGLDSLVSLEDITASSLEISQVNSLPNKGLVTTLNLNNSGLTSIDLSSFTNVENLYLPYNNLSSLDLSLLPNLKLLDISSNVSLTSLDISSNPLITQLNFNDILGISITGINALSLTGLAFDVTNYIVDLTLPEFTNLESVSGRYNGITSIDVTNLTKMKYFDYSSNSISTINGLSNMIQLIYFNLDNNLLDASNIDNIFNTINGFGTSNGTIIVTNNSPPTSSSLSSRNDLESRGWILEFD